MRGEWRNSRFAGTAVMLGAFWLMVTGNITVLNLFLGAVIGTGIAYFNRELIFTYRELPPLTPHNTWILIRHVGLLVYEIIKANWIMARIVLSPRMRIDPGLVILRPKIKSEMIQVALANSISLTPGTLTLDVKDDVFTIHIIDAAGAPALADWNVEKQLETIKEVSS